MADPSYLHRRRSPSPPRGPASHRNRDSTFNRLRDTTRRATLPSQSRSPERSFTRGREPLRRAETSRESRSRRSRSPLPRFTEFSQPQREHGSVRPEPEKTVSSSAVETQHEAKSSKQDGKQAYLMICSSLTPYSSLHHLCSSFAAPFG